MSLIRLRAPSFSRPALRACRGWERDAAGEPGSCQLPGQGTCQDSGAGDSALDLVGTNQTAASQWLRSPLLTGDRRLQDVGRLPWGLQVLRLQCREFNAAAATGQLAWAALGLQCSLHSCPPAHLGLGTVEEVLDCEAAAWGRKARCTRARPNPNKLCDACKAGAMVRDSALPRSFHRRYNLQDPFCTMDGAAERRETQHSQHVSLPQPGQ